MKAIQVKWRSTANQSINRWMNTSSTAVSIHQRLHTKAINWWLKDAINGYNIASFWWLSIDNYKSSKGQKSHGLMWKVLHQFWKLNYKRFSKILRTSKPTISSKATRISVSRSTIKSKKFIFVFVRKRVGVYFCGLAYFVLIYIHIIIFISIYPNTKELRSKAVDIEGKIL